MQSAECERNQSPFGQYLRSPLPWCFAYPGKRRGEALAQAGAESLRARARPGGMLTGLIFEAIERSAGLGDGRSGPEIGEFVLGGRRDRHRAGQLVRFAVGVAVGDRGDVLGEQRGTEE